MSVEKYIQLRDRVNLRIQQVSNDLPSSVATAIDFLLEEIASLQEQLKVQQSQIDTLNRQLENRTYQNVTLGGCGPAQ
jgi:chromosome segregation ATPase